MNVNVKLLSELVFTYALSIYFFKIGVSEHNASMITAARSKFAPLFYITNMVGYQEVWYRDVAMRLVAPEELNHMFDLDSVATVDNHHFQGGDFVLENFNKKIKSFCPEGVPSNQDWVDICRNLDNLEKVMCYFFMKFICIVLKELSTYVYKHVI